MNELLGLRGRLTAALVGVSILTVLVTAVLVLAPLDNKLEQDTLSSLDETARGATSTFTAMSPAEIRANSPRLQAAVKALRRQTDTEVFVFDDSGRMLAGTDVDSSDRFPEIATALREHRVVARFARDGGRKEAHIAAPFRSGGRRGVLDMRGSLERLGAVQGVVRRSLVAAGFVALAVALLAGIALAARLVRRLSALRSTALEMADQGVGDITPVDDGHRDEVGDLARAFATMQRRLAAQEQARRTFVSTASHELRTPLTSLGLMLHGATEELTEPQPDLPETRDQLRRALRQTERLGRLAAELLDLSRLDAGIELRSEPVELVQLARTVLAEFDDVLPRAELAAERPVWTQADPGAIARIARILLDNAHHHAGPDGDIVLRVDASGPAIEVTDSGPGIAADDEERIFERFQRGPEARDDGGFGLGLAIGRELARQMGGELRLVPGGHGATFRCTLPPAEEDTPPGA